MRQRLRLRLALIATGWSLGVVQAIFEGTSYLLQGRPIPWANMGWNWLTYGLSALLLPWLVERARANPFERERWRRQIPALVGRVVMAVAIEATAWSLLRKTAEWAGGKPYDMTILWRALLGGDFLLNVYLFAAFSIGAGAVEASRRLHERNLAAARLESELATARLRLLKAQLNPHFLFNTLNTVSALVERDPRQAHRTISRLSDFLRVLLDAAGQEEVTLEQELEHLSLYVGIQQTRFRDRLVFEVEVADDLLDVAVPHLLLQPLVENAIQHGALPRRPLRVLVRAAARAGTVEVTVEDDGRGLRAAPPAGPEHHGVGLGSTRARLRTLLGPGEHLTLSPRPGGGTTATVRLPERRLTEAELLARPAPGGVAAEALP